MQEWRDGESQSRPIASKGGRSIQQMMSGVLMAAKRAHAESPLQPLPGEPEEERVRCSGLQSFLIQGLSVTVTVLGRQKSVTGAGVSLYALSDNFLIKEDSF